MKRCLIVGAGEFCVEKFKPEKDDFIIAADGGMEYLKDISCMPNVIIGDMDSITEKTRKYMYENKKVQFIQLPEEKDETDILAAIKLGLNENYKEFHIFGGTGGRLDHTIANIHCLIFIKEFGCQGYLYGINETLQVICNETITFPKENKGRISVFPVEESAMGVTLNGLRYPLNNYTMKNTFPIGVSNEFIGMENSITVIEGKLLLIY